MRVPSVRDIKREREQIALQFEQQRLRLDLTIVRSLSNYKYIVSDRGKQYRALVLPCSFDYYEYRLNVGKQRVEMLIVSRHNAVVPVVVVSLEQIMLYEPLAAPDLGREQRKKNDQEDAQLLLSKYILNFESAHEELAKMTPRSRQRYRRKKERYLKKRIGRPWAS
jgi:hypothetical protein